MTTSPRLNLPYLAPQQAQKHVTVNESLRRLDALTQLSVVSATQTAEPGGPAEGACYIVPVGATGSSWGAMSAGSIAVFQDAAWVEIAPLTGWRAWVADQAAVFVFSAGAWTLQASGGGGSQSAPQFGVNATADTVNRLTVKSDAALFSHDDVTPGSGDMRIVCNKAGSNDFGGVLFQSAYSGRAEFGLLGGDDFVFKVSADGTNWKEALKLDKDDGLLTCIGFVGVGFNNNFDVRMDTVDGADNKRFRMTAGGAASTSRGAIMLLSGNEYAGTAGEATLLAGAGAAVRLIGSKIMVESGGLVVGSPTGDNKGAGTVNAQAVYDDNTLLSCYVFDQALDGAIDPEKWDAKVPDRVREARDPMTGEVLERSVEARRHEPMRKFAARTGGAHDPLTLDGYARHWREKRHLPSMPNEATYDSGQGLSGGEWIQRLVETAEIQAVLIDRLHERLKALESASLPSRRA